MVQHTPGDLFKQLRGNDILFIDSSHVARAGSDVVHLLLEVLPLLGPGVLVHFHDIYLPFHYKRDVLSTFIHNNETPFVQAFLIYNKHFEILFALSQLHYSHPKELQRIFPGYHPQASEAGLNADPGGKGQFPSSLWLRTK